MNIFALSELPEEAAKFHNNSHVVKMIVESAQLLSTAHRVLDGNIVTITDEKNGKARKKKIWEFQSNDPRLEIYAATHINHPCSVWTRASSENYQWLYQLWEELIKEWHFRFSHNKVHRCEKIRDLIKALPNNITIGKRTPFALAMPEERKISNDPVECYREYYRKDKAHLSKWGNRDSPIWMVK